VRLKIAVGSTPSSLYISKPLHSGTPGTPDPLFPLEDLSSIPRILPQPPRAQLAVSLRYSLAKLYGSVAVFKNFSGIPATGQVSSPKGRNRVGDARQPEIDRLHSGAELPPMPQR